jgi:surfeit locus 1 family protein
VTAAGDPIGAPTNFADEISPERHPRSPAALTLILAIALALFAGLIALGVWQVHRRAWKLALIEHVAERIHATPVPAPGPRSWPALSAANDEYRHVAVKGRFRNDRETLVQANTDLGAGFWVLTPFDTGRGFIVLVNRGFVTPEHRDPATRRDGQIDAPRMVTGLLRITEPKGAFLRHNDPAAGRWYSRDVAAIARARRLGAVAPYFIDADRGAGPADAPVGGLTVVRFPNNHLVYAITWFALALMTAIGAALLIRDERRLRRERRR